MSSRAIARNRALQGLTALVAAGALACGDESPTVVPPPDTGSLELTVETTGFLQDDSYNLLINGQNMGTIAADAQQTFNDLDVATYEVSLGDVADNCSFEPGSVAVPGGGTGSLTINVSCEHAASAAYAGLRASRDRPDLEDGTAIECSFGICPSDVWDIYVEFTTDAEPQALIRQNQNTAAEIAHLPGVTLAELTEEDFNSATFTTDLIEEALVASSVVLIRTAQGKVYAVGNPLVEDGFTTTVSLEAALIAEPAS